MYLPTSSGGAPLETLLLDALAFDTRCAQPSFSMGYFIPGVTTACRRDDDHNDDGEEEEDDQMVGVAVGRGGGGVGCV